MTQRNYRGGPVYKFRCTYRSVDQCMLLCRYKSCWMRQSPCHTDNHCSHTFRPSLCPDCVHTLSVEKIKPSCVSISQPIAHTQRFVSALSTHSRVLLIVAVVRVAATVISRVLVTRERSCPTLTVTVTLLSITHTLSPTWVRKVYITVTYLTWECVL